MPLKKNFVWQIFFFLIKILFILQLIPFNHCGGSVSTLNEPVDWLI